MENILLFQQFDSMCKAEVAFFIARAFINVSNFDVIERSVKNRKGLLDLVKQLYFKNEFDFLS